MGEMPTTTVGLVSSDHVGWAGVRAALGAAGQLRVVDLPPLPPAAPVSEPEPDLDVLLVAARPGPVPLPCVAAVWLARHARARLLIVGDLLTVEELATLRGLRSHGYVLWEQITAASIVQIVRQVAAGGLAVHSMQVIEGWRARQATPLPADLTRGERAALRGVERGWTRKEIRREEGYSARSIGRAYQALRARVGARSDEQLGMRLHARGWIADLPDGADGRW